MKKINYRLVYNRKKSLNSEGKALVQVEAYLESKKIYFSTHVTQQVRPAVAVYIYQHKVISHCLVETVEQLLCMHLESRITITVK